MQTGTNSERVGRNPSFLLGYSPPALGCLKLAIYPADPMSQASKLAVFWLIALMNQTCHLRHKSTVEQGLNQYEVKLCDFTSNLRVR